MRALTACLVALSTAPALADENIPDQYPGSPLYSKPVEVIPHVWSAIGATAPPNAMPERICRHALLLFQRSTRTHWTKQRASTRPAFCMNPRK